jgi:YbbR domain-containing protein
MAYHPFRHLGLKALSVAIAVLLWLSVSGEQIVERSLRIPLELQNAPERLELVGDLPPATVDARVRGTSGVLSHLSAGDVVAVLDLSTARAGRRYFQLSVEDVRAPFGIEVTQVSPPTVELQFDLVVTRQVKVVPTIEGNPASGYMVDAYSCQPESVDVVGPESTLREVTRVSTDPISVAGATQPMRESVTLGVAGQGVRLKTPGKAMVSIDIRPVPVERLIENVAVHIHNLPARLRGEVTPRVVAVTVRGSKDTIDPLSPEAFNAFVDLAGRVPGRYNLQVHVEPPQNVEILRIEPATAVIRVR